MKKIFTFLFLALFAFGSYAQAPEGIIYQAEARDNAGRIIENQTLDVKITILENDYNGVIVWEGLHNVTTNKFGMFVLVIGTGENTYGYPFEEINWGEVSHFLNVQVKRSATEEWIDMGTTQFLSVPYALYAKSAGSIVSDSELELKGAKPGVPSQTWSLFGNSNTDPDKDKFGTTDPADLVFITDNKERLRITADGKLITPDGVGLDLGGNLKVRGDSTTIDKDLFVGRNVYLNTNEEFDPRGETINYGNFTVENMSSTKLTGTLMVDKETDLNSALSVKNSSPTYLSGTLTVDYNTDLKSTLNVDENSQFNKNLTVSDTASSRSLSVKDNLADGGFLATFENTNNDKGDGIKIKLGKKATKNGGGFDVIDDGLQIFVGEGFGPDNASDIKSLFDGDINNDDLEFVASMLLPSPEDALALLATTCTIGETIINMAFEEIDTLLEDTPIPYLGHVDFDCDKIGGSAFEWPEFDFADQANTLNGENTFIEFTDNTNWKIGAIKAQSIDEWASQYLDPVFMYELYSTFKGLDKSTVLTEVKKVTRESAKSYLAIGVEYSSGNGDYAEWLERMDPKEVIGAGDIVAVKAGKITKDLTDAEQIMAVSHRPIVLGNIPEEGKNHLGNNIAFMGQIPVKIMGAVSTGDYIVANSNIPGYGIAINPQNMTIEDFKLAVGRAWEENADNGAKMVNTVVGVHNGDYLNILKRYEQKFRESEARLESVEAKIDALSGLLQVTNKSE